MLCSGLALLTWQMSFEEALLCMVARHCQFSSGMALGVQPRGIALQALVMYVGSNRIETFYVRILDKQAEPFCH